MKELKVKLGDKVNEGSVVLLLERRGRPPRRARASGCSSAQRRSCQQPRRGRAPAAASYAGGADLECDMLVLGAGPGGYSAAFRAADLGLKVVLVERYATLGGVCLNVGCIPSKALLHVAAVMDEVKHFADLGVSFGAPTVDIDKLRGHKKKVIGKLTGGLAAMAKMRKVTVVRGYGAFVDPNHVEVEETTGTRAGQDRQDADHRASSNASSPPARRPCACPSCPTTRASSTPPARWSCANDPKRMLILGGGIIGLEMGTVYSTLGARLDVVEMLDGLMQGADRDLVKVWQKMNAPRFDNIMLKTKTVGAEATAGRHRGDASRARARPKEPQLYDLVLQAVGRSPNGKKIAADKAGVAVTTAASSRWTSRCAPTCRTSSPSATSSASRCWRTRRCTRRMWRPK